MALRGATALAAVLLASGLGAGAHAASFVNGSFEQPGGGAFTRIGLADGSTYVTGWTVHGGGFYYESSSSDGLDAKDGDFWLAFGHSDAHGGYITQSFDTLAGVHYTLDYDFALQQGQDDGSGFRLSVSTGDTVDSGSGLRDVWTSGPALTFTGTGAQVLLTIADITPSSSGGASNLALDNLRLSSDAVAGGVPEPAAWGLMIMGFGGAGTLLRRRRAARAA